MRYRFENNCWIPCFLLFYAARQKGFTGDENEAFKRAATRSAVF